MDRRGFLERTGAAAAGAMAGPLVVTSRGAARTDRLVVAVGQWGIETPLAWRSVQAEKPLWDCVYDPLILRDPRTWDYRPWTFRLRSGVKFHEGWGDFTADTGSCWG